ncbi:hypothetical protein WA158_000154 [Blastocystis sp. Blastoise]
MFVSRVLSKSLALNTANRLAPKTLGSLRFLNLHEYQSKQLINKYGGVTQVGDIAVTASKAQSIANDIWRQFLAGGRGKGHFDSGLQGGVKLASSPKEVAQLAEQMIGHKIFTKQTGAKGILCEKVLICGAVDIKKEFYFAILLDRAIGCPVMIASPNGGVDIEEVSKTKPETIFKLPIDVKTGIDKVALTNFAKNLGVEGKLLDDCVQNMEALYTLFTKCDATMVEINPLSVVENPTHDESVCCIDAKLNFDGDAKFRQPEIFAMRDKSQEDPRDVAASEAGVNYVGLDGNIGCMVNGAGLAMATMDIIKLNGGNPANFLDVGGAANKNQIISAIKILRADQHVKAILVNIFGGIVRCDVVAQGIVDAVKETNLDLPLVVRLEGTNVEVGKKIIKESGLKVIAADDLDDAAKKAVSTLQH